MTMTATQTGARWQLEVCALPVLMSCGETSDPLSEHEIAGSIMGTTYSVRIIDPPVGYDESATTNDVAELLAAINRALSTYDSESALSAFNQSTSTTWIETSTRLCDVVAGAQEIGRQTGGAFDITVGPLVNLWGFGPGKFVDEPPSATLVEDTLRRVGNEHLDTDCDRPAMRKKIPDLYVDLSAYAKGYAVDRVAELLNEIGADNYLVEIGGEMRVRGLNARAEPWAIAIERPTPASRIIQTVVRLSDASLATSGDYRNFFEHEGVHYSHTIDPRTGWPVRHSAASVTVIADEAARADALATALLVLGPDDGMALAEQERIAALFLIRSGGKVEERMTSRFAAESER